MEGFREWLKRHKVLAAFGGLVLFVVWELPEWLGNVWPAFVKDKTVPEWVAEHHWPGMTGAMHDGLAISMFIVL
jgi:hypothetical protein